MTEGETSKQRLEGRVAEILNEREVAINLGSEEGVAPEMRFAILSGHPYVIKDPETGDELGEVDRPKVRVKVSLVKDRFCLARTYETYSVNIGGTGAGIGDLAKLFTSPKWVTKVKTLRVDQSDLPGELSEEDSIVKINDRVIQLFDNEDDLPG